MTEKRLGNVSSRVLEYLTANVGNDVNLWDIMEATDLDERRVQYAMGHLRDRNGLPIATIVRGSMWRLEDRAEDVPETSKDPEPDAYAPPVRRYIEVGTSSTGVVIVEGPTGDLWKIVAL